MSSSYLRRSIILELVGIWYYNTELRNDTGSEQSFFFGHIKLLSSSLLAIDIRKTILYEGRRDKYQMCIYKEKRINTYLSKVS